MRNKIIHVAGTMGAGKTTVIRKLMEGRDVDVWYQGTRKAPVGYSFELPGVEHPICVVGSYEVAIASGCDTIKDVKWNYDLIYGWFKEGYHVVYEGLFMMNHTRGVQLQRDTKAVEVLRLTTPVATCIESVRGRREVQGVKKALSDSFLVQLKGSDVRAKNYAMKMRLAGSKIFAVSREEALGVLLSQLKETVYA